MKEIDPLSRLAAFVAKFPTQGKAADALEISGALLNATPHRNPEIFKGCSGAAGPPSGRRVGRRRQ